MNNNPKLMLIFLTSLSLYFNSGCSTQPKYTPIKPIAKGSSIELIIDVPEINTPNAKDEMESFGKGLSQGAGTGAAAGAVAGLQHSVVCGPYILFCAPFLSVIGAAGGSIVGGLAGGIHGGMVSLPTEKAKILEETIALTLLELDIENLLYNEFVIQTDDSWNIKGADPDIKLSLGVEALYLQQYIDDQLALQVVNSVVITYGLDTNKKTKRILYKHTSKMEHVDHWINDNGAELKAEINKGFKDNVRKIHDSLILQ